MLTVTPVRSHAGADLLGRAGRGVDVGLRQQREELLAAEPAELILGAHVLAQLAGHGGQHAVALGVPVAVVDGLEVVDVDDRDRQVAVVAAGAATPCRRAA